MHSYRLPSFLWPIVAMDLEERNLPGFISIPAPSPQTVQMLRDISRSAPITGSDQMIHSHLQTWRNCSHQQRQLMRVALCGHESVVGILRSLKHGGTEGPWMSKQRSRLLSWRSAPGYPGWISRVSQDEAVFNIFKRYCRPFVHSAKQDGVNVFLRDQFFSY